MHPRRPQRLASEDLEVRDRVLDGDAQAAEELFERHVDALFDFAYHRVGRDAAAAEDVVQDTLMLALQKLRDFDGRSSLHTWLCGIARNKIREGRRRRRPARVEDLLRENDAEIDAILSQIEREPLPDEVLAARETQELVGATLSSLPPDYRSVLVAKYVDGHTVPQMASASGRGVKAVESTLHRARQAFSRVFVLLSKKRGGLS